MNIFKEFIPLHDVYHDDSVILAHIAGGSMIGASFLALGLVFITLAGRYTEEKRNIKERIRISKMIGWALIVCSLSRFFDVLCIWHNFAIISAILKDLTGILGLITLGYIPFILKILKNQATLQEVKNSLVETKEKIEQIKKINETLKK